MLKFSRVCVNTYPSNAYNFTTAWHRELTPLTPSFYHPLSHKYSLISAFSLTCIPGGEGARNQWQKRATSPAASPQSRALFSTPSKPPRKEPLPQLLFCKLWWRISSRSAANYPLLTCRTSVQKLICLHILSINYFSQLQSENFKAV